MEFTSKEFKQNLNAATDFIVTAKWENKDCRFRIETDVRSPLVKVYAIEKGKIVAVLHFKNGKQSKEEIR